MDNVGAVAPFAGREGRSEKGDDSRIAKFYAGKHVLLTGCPGYLGTLILEKLLRTCTDVDKIYIMIRPKRDVSAEERMKKMLQNEVFDRMRGANPNFGEKIVPIYGDLQKPDLGISSEDRLRLTSNANIIIHNAAMVYFFAKPSVLLRINVIGTLKLLELAAECRSFDLFVYTSTAYSHHHKSTIGEEFYAPPCGLETILDIIRVDEENATGLSKEALKDIIGSWINLYSFSKAVTEGVVHDFSRKHSLPCIVYRPSILSETYKEPIDAWVGNKHGPIVITHACALGILRVVRMIKKNSMDFVPADFTTNNLLAIIWDHVTYRKSKEPEVYNYASSDWNSFTIKMAVEQFPMAVRKYPLSKMVWYPSFMTVENSIGFFILHTLWHVFPAIIVDLILLLRLRKPMAIKMLLKAYKNHDELIYFFSNWVIKTDKSKRILDRMNATDLSQFQFNLNEVNWNKKVEMILRSIRRLTKEPVDKNPVADRKFRTMQILHYIVCSFIILFWLFFIHRMMHTFYNY